MTATPGAPPARHRATTHTAGDVVTELDFMLIARIDAIAAAHSAKPS